MPCTLCSVAFTLVFGGSSAAEEKLANLIAAHDLFRIDAVPGGKGEVMQDN